MRFLLSWLLLGAAATALPDQADAQIEGKSMAYGRIRCDSYGPESVCPIDTSRGVRLVREFSRNRCVQGRTWDWDPYRIWVSDGCQAEFEIGSGGSGGGPGREIVCESRSSRLHYCEADTRFGAELLQQLSRAECIRDRTWGYDRRAIWVSNGCRGRFLVGISASGRPPEGSGWGGGSGWSNDPPGTIRIQCESTRGSREYCQFPFAARNVQLVQNFGRDNCRQGRNWNWGEGGVWVEGYCAGEFLVFPLRGGSSWGGSGHSQRIVCESNRGRMHYCPAQGTISSVSLLRQISTSPCIEGQSWGWDRRAVWVNDGCRAEFEVLSY